MNDNSINGLLINIYDADKIVSKALLKISLTPDSSDKSLRVTDDNGSTYFYASTRIGTLLKTDNGYEADVTAGVNLEGKKYQLKEASTGKLLQEGIIELSERHN